MRFRSLQWKWIGLTLLVIVTGCIALGGIALGAINSVIVQAGQDKLKSDLATGLAYVEQRYNGSWAVDNGVLTKGTEVVGAASLLPNDVGRLTGVDCQGLRRWDGTDDCGIRQSNEANAGGKRACSALEHDGHRTGTVVSTF